MAAAMGRVAEATGSRGRCSHQARAVGVGRRESKTAMCTMYGSTWKGSKVSDDPKIGVSGMQQEDLGARRGDMGPPEMGSLMTLSRLILTEMTPRLAPQLSLMPSFETTNTHPSKRPRSKSR